jgi:AraC-like DNA-binding protein
MRNYRNSNKQLPVVRLILVQPFLEAALIDGVDVDAVLSPLGMASLAFNNPDIFVPATTMYDIVEALADACSDPFVGANLGLQLNPFQWPPLVSAAKLSQSVGDFLLRFSIDAYKDANSVVFQLQTKGTRTSFREIRLTDGGRAPRHNDAFGVAYILQILKAAVGDAWDGKQVIAEVCDPSVLPGKFYGIRLASTDKKGFSLSFPCEWLLLKPVLQQAQPLEDKTISTRPAPASVLDLLSYVLRNNLDNQNLRAEHVAKLCGVSRRTLSRKLTESGTTLNREIATLKTQRAKTLLENPELSISKISSRVGYNDPSVFTRAFRRWTGVNPSEYRSGHR